MIVNPDKFQAILLDKRKGDHTNQRIVVDNQNLKVVSSVELLFSKEKRILINSCFMTNFNCGPLVWMFSSASSLKKIENLQKKAQRFLYNDYEISYEDFIFHIRQSNNECK